LPKVRLSWERHNGNADEGIVAILGTFLVHRYGGIRPPENSVTSKTKYVSRADKGSREAEPLLAYWCWRAGHFTENLER
jgi:hypothetical protein